MVQRPAHHRLTAAILTLTIVLITIVQTGCGTILHPERKGQPAGRIDPAIAILDGLGLLLFIIPGVIAFAVDFSNGTIYLPPDEANASGDATAGPAQATDPATRRVVRVDPDTLDRDKLAAIIKEHTGHDVTLTEADMQVLRQRDADRAMQRILERSDND